MFSFCLSLTEHLGLIYINACCAYSKIKNAAMTAAFSLLPKVSGCWHA
jgi:hypothetical protein